MDWYGDNDREAAAWLRALIVKGALPNGDVDARDVRDIEARSLAGYRRCHFFAGIGGWPLALALAGWPDAWPVWTGSCPCQPLSCAGRRGGDADERHLWPAFFRLIAERRPAVVLGEQVAAADGREWLAALRADLEHLGYAVGAADLPAAGVGAPHIRQRLFWVAYDGGAGLEGRADRSARSEREAVERDGAARRLADGESGGRGAQPPHGGGRGAGDGAEGLAAGFGASGAHLRRYQDHGGWAHADWLGCRDGRWRPVEPGTFPLAHGISARVGRMRGYGNAIVPQLGAVFARAVLDVIGASGASLG